MEFLKDLLQGINKVPDINLQTKLEEIYSNIYNCAKKMASGTNFIDFFVHDILDFSILEKNEENFTKNISVFNMSSAVDEIIESLTDKTQMK